MEKNTLVTKFSDGETIDLNDLSVNELYELHYQEESYVVKEILKLPPFSIERDQLLKDGYVFVFKLMSLRDIKEFGTPQETFGSGRASANALIKLINKKIKSHKQSKINFCEIGVGTGFTIRKILESIKGVDLHIQGCDIRVAPSALQLVNDFPNVDIKDMNAYEFIKSIPNNSIDVLYSDNVFEHFCPDEAVTIYDELIKKLKSEAILLIIIPNSYTGPHDIARRFLPMGTKSNCFHYNEMTFREVTDLFESYGVYQKYCVSYIFKIHKFILIKSKFFINIKLRMENLLAKIPIKSFRFLLFYFLGYHVSILEKRK